MVGRDRGQEPSNRECPDHIGAVGTYMWTYPVVIAEFIECIN